MIIGSTSIDLSLSNIWKSWYKFSRGKRSSLSLNKFKYFLEKNLYQLHIELENGNYNHGNYYSFKVFDNKPRRVSVAGIRDRVVHRLVYEYLVDIYDKRFIFDVYSNRKEKGLLKAIARVQKFLRGYSKCYIWRADIKKFFDNVDHEILLNLLFLKIFNTKARSLLKKIVKSYSAVNAKNKGIPIGNLTSQVFANIYLNELDRFIKHNINPLAYLRYGDDFILIEGNPDRLALKRKNVINFLKTELLLETNSKNDKIIKAKNGLKFLGLEIFPRGRRLNQRNQKRIHDRLNYKNISSYKGLIKNHGNKKKINYFNWLAIERLKI